jgi:hypothetical protein
MKENTAVAIYNRITFPVLEIWHQLDLFTSMHHLIIRVVSILSFVLFFTSLQETRRI